MSFSVNVTGCLPCCGSNCVYTMPSVAIEGTSTPYADLATANAAMAATAISCLIDVRSTLGGPAASISGASLIVTDALTQPSNANNDFVFAATLAGGSTLSVDYGISGSIIASYTLRLYTTAWSLLESVSGMGSPTGTLTVNANTDGCYYVLSTYAVGPFPGGADSFTFYSSNTWTVGTIQAAWTNGGGTSYAPC